MEETTFAGSSRVASGSWSGSSVVVVAGAAVVVVWASAVGVALVVDVPCLLAGRGPCRRPRRTRPPARPRCRRLAGSALEPARTR